MVARGVRAIASHPRLASIPDSHPGRGARSPTRASSEFRPISPCQFDSSSAEEGSPRTFVRLLPSF
jgi:hypothetical protein